MMIDPVKSFSVPDTPDGKPTAFVSLVGAHSISSVTQEPAPGMHGIELGSGPEICVLAKTFEAPVVASVAARASGFGIRYYDEEGDAFLSSYFPI
jgi:hypothetical protein